MSPDVARHAARQDAASAATIASVAGTIEAPGKCTRQYAPNVARTPRFPSGLEVTAQSIVTTASDSVVGQLPHEDSKVTLDLDLGDRETN